jgi:hypothetical protein
MTALLLNHLLGLSPAIDQAAAAAPSDFLPGSWSRIRSLPVFAHPPGRPRRVPYESGFRISRRSFLTCESG